MYCDLWCSPSYILENVSYLLETVTCLFSTLKDALETGNILVVCYRKWFATPARHSCLQWRPRTVLCNLIFNVWNWLEAHRSKLSIVSLSISLSHLRGIPPCFNALIAQGHVRASRCLIAFNTKVFYCYFYQHWSHWAWTIHSLPIYINCLFALINFKLSSKSICSPPVSPCKGMVNSLSAHLLNCRKS